MTPAAAKQRAYRRRRAAGQVTLRIVIDDTAVAEALIAAGLLAPDRSDDRKALAGAVVQLLEMLGRDVEGRYR
jgi:hypothetical protein